MESTSESSAGAGGASRLFTDFLYDFEKVRAYYRFSGLKSVSYRESAAAIQCADEHRRRLVEALREQNGECPALDLLARPGTCVVATGQQVGLFSGPAYTIYKALTAARLARDLTQQGAPAVPVFWLATEDHDLEEVDHCWVFGQDHQPLRIEAACEGAPGQPVGGVTITGNPVERLREALEGLPFAAEVLELTGAAYGSGRTLGSAFSRLLRGLLGAYGLIHLDPLRPAIRELAAPMLAQAAARAPELVNLLLERNRELESAGYHAQVRVEPSSSLLFTLEGGRRTPLRLKDGGGPAAGQPALLSPNALLRPVVQDYLLPTVAVVMGPAEVAYMAQAEVLYRSLLGRQPVVVSRASFTLADARSAKLMERYRFSLSDLAAGEEELRSRIAGCLVPGGLKRSLEEAAADTADRLERLRAEIAGFDPSLAEAAGRSRRKILYQMSKLERKVAREALRRDERAGREAAGLYGLLYPRRQPQERIYSILPFLAKHGMGLIETVYENLRWDKPGHHVLVV
ncbi:MAG: bacillithiol biosynthesis BshC [Bryobacteraceae bacterium]